MTRSLSSQSRAGVVLMMAFVLVGCGAVVSRPPTLIPSPSTTPAASLDKSATSCIAGYTWAHGSVPREFITQVHEAMRASGLEGSVQASTFGENDSCGAYLAKDVDYSFTVRVQSLEASEDLAGKASTILDIARRSVEASPAHNLGKLQLTFQAEDGQECGWSYSEGAWNSAGSGPGSFSVCPAPVSEESSRLAEALNALSFDLACETSAHMANTLQALLECERPEGNNRYLVTVTLRLNGQGYEGSCFHGYKAFENSSTGDQPMTVTEGTNTYYERDRTIQWTANGVFYDLFERIKGGSDVTFPPETAEKVFQRALQEGLIPGEGSDCR